MNLYFLVEGLTELKVYPQWLKHLIPHLTRVNFAEEADSNHYYLISGLGYPHLLDKALVHSVAEINELGLYDYLILVIDADNFEVQEKIDEIYQFIKDNGIFLKPSCQLKIIVQKPCIETWFLGNKKVYTKAVSQQSNFYNHAKFYDVSEQDPELMKKLPDYARSVSAYHETYLRAMLAEKNIRYSKSEPHAVHESYYLEQLQKRIYDSTHLASLKQFFEFCDLVL